MATTTRFPIDLRVPGVTGNPGNAFWLPIVLTAATPGFDLGCWQFLLDVEGDIFGIINIPNTIGGTPAGKIILTIAANATTGASRLSVDARPIANDAESLDQVLDTTVAAQDITLPATAYMTKEVSFTLPTSGNGFPVVAKDRLLIRLVHEGAHANDTLAVNTLLISAELEVDLT